ALAGELERSSSEFDRSLARLARAGAAALRDEPEGVLAPFRDYDPQLLPPALAELGYEITSFARRAPSGGGLDASPLNHLRNKLIEALDLPPALREGLLRVGRNTLESLPGSLLPCPC